MQLPFRQFRPFFKTSERTPLQYLLDPVLAFVTRSLREP